MQPIVLKNATLVDGKSADILVEDRKMLLLKHGGTVNPAYQVFKGRERLYRIVNCENMLVAPGMINSHTHAAMGFFRGGAHVKATNMIKEVLFPAEKKLVPEMVQDLCFSFLVDALRNGVTCLFDHYYFADGVAKACAELGMRAIIGETICDLDGAHPGDQSFDRACELIESFDAQGGLLQPCVAPHATDSVSQSLLQKSLQLAKSHDLMLHIHAAQTQDEWDAIQKNVKQSPVQFLESQGVLGEKTLLAHVIHADEQDFKKIAGSGASIAFCPISQVHFNRLAPIEMMLNADINICLATDCSASHDSADLMRDLRFTYMHLKSNHEALFDSKPLGRYFDMFWKNSARFWKGESIGCIADGALADLVFYDMDLPFLPCDYPLETLAFSSRRARHVMINGKFVLYDDQLVSADEKSLTKRFRQAAQKIFA